MKTYLYNFDPLKPHFYIVKLGITGVYIIFLISAQKHKLWVLVRTALLRESNKHPQSMFWAEIWKISEFFIWKLSFFGDEISIYLNRRVVVRWSDALYHFKWMFPDQKITWEACTECDLEIWEYPQCVFYTLKISPFSAILNSSKPFFFPETNNAWHFIWIVCYIDNTDEMSSLIFLEKVQKNVSHLLQLWMVH